jgi:hypothetical protein
MSDRERGRSADPRWSAATFSPSALNYAVDPRHASAHTAPSQHPPIAPSAGLLDGFGPHWSRQRQAAEHSGTPTRLSATRAEPGAAALQVLSF